ncbi:MAG: membrane protein insertion efficiency factor YidD [Chlamydiae bacterium]|nr:membrane protein insertion efficiency factor YidD [Chlamydiota bacterium]
MRFNFFLLLFIPCALMARPGYFEPWGKDSDLKIPTQEKSNQKNYSIPVQIADKIIKFHQDIISPVDGPRSHFRPTSSRYMQLAMYRHGFIKGFIMGCDRLLRENKDPWVYRTIDIDGKRYKFDPVRK